MTAQPVVVELDYDGSWHEVAQPRASAGITITQGQSDEGSGPTSARLTLDNRSGDYNPRNTTGSLYGLIGRYTPIRVCMRPGNTTGPMADASDDFSTNHTDSWGTADVGGAWSRYGEGGTVADANWQVASGEATHNLPAANTQRMSYLNDLEILDCTQAVTFTCPQATGASLYPAGLLFRGVSTTEYVRVRVEVTTGNAVNLMVIGSNLTSIWGQLTVADLTHAGAGTPLRVKARAVGWDVFAKVWDPAGPEPDWQLRATETSTLLEGLLSYLTPPTPVPGFVGIRSGRATGNTNSSGPQFSYDDYEVTVDDPRFVGEVSAWRPRRLLGGDQITDIEAHGILHRLGQDTTPLAAPLTRMALALEPVAYWPLTDESGAEVGANAVATGPPMKVLSVHLDANNTPSNTSGIIQWAADDGPPGSPNAPAVYATDGSTEDFAVLRGFPGGASASGWTVIFCFKASTTSGSAAFDLMRIRTSERETRYWNISINSSGFLVSDVYDLDVAQQTGFAADVDFVGDLRDGQWRFVCIKAEQTSPGTITVELTTYAPGGLSSTANDTASTFTLGIVAQIDIPFPGTGFTAVDGLWVSGVGVFDEALDDFWVDQLRRSAFGFSGALTNSAETAGERLWRLCVEENVPFSHTGELGFVGVGGTEPMGVQSVATFPDLLTECATADIGLLYEPRWGRGIHYRTRTDLYNQAAALALDFDAGDIAPPMDPDIDERVVNDVTVTRTGGSKFRATLTSGALSTQDPPDGIGRAPATVTANVETDQDLQSQAYWRLHVGTWDESRYPRLTLYGDAAADLNIGDVVTITNLEPDTVLLMVVGYTEQIDTHFRQFTLVCVPAGPFFDIGIWDTSTYGDARFSM